MIIRCKTCYFYYNTDNLFGYTRCPLCNQVNGPALKSFPAITIPKPLLVKPTGQPSPQHPVDADRMLRALMGISYQIAQYPFALAIAGVINLAGKIRDPLVNKLKHLKFCVDAPSTVSWAWQPTFEGASRLRFDSLLEDQAGSVMTNLQLLDVPLGYTFLAPQHKQRIFFKSVNTNRTTGFFGCIKTKVEVSDQYTGEGTGPLRPAKVSGQVALSEVNKPTEGLFDFTSLSMTVDLVQVQYLGSFMRPTNFYNGAKLAKYLALKKETGLQVSVMAEKVDVGIDWGGTKLNIPVSGTADVDMVFLDEPVFDDPGSRMIARGEVNAKLTKMWDYSLPAWGIFQRKFKVEGFKAKSGRMTWKVPPPKIEKPPPDKFQKFLEEFGPL